MKNLSTSWAEVSLGEICEFKYGKSLPELKRTGGNIPVFGSNGIIGQHNEAITDGSTIVIGRKGSLGEVNFSNVSCWPIDTTYYIDKSATDTDLKWLAYQLSGLGLTKLNKAAAVPGLNREDAYRQRLLLPPLEEQRRIAEVLDRAEELRSKRREAIAQLDTLTQAIFIEMFGDPVVNPFKFPFLPLENVISRSFQNGAYFPKEAYCNEGGVEMIHMSDAFEGIVKRGNLKRVVCSQQDIERYKLSNTDLIVARRSLNYEGSVKPCLIPSSNEPLIFESSLIRITPNPEKVKILYLFYYILNPYVRERFIFPFVTQSTISGINQGNLAKVLLMLPPIDLQNEFAHRVEAVEKLKAAHRASLSELDALFASLQHRAFRGEL